MEGLANFILTDQIALGGAGIGIGYVSSEVLSRERSPLSRLLRFFVLLKPGTILWLFLQGIASSLLWLGLSQLGNPTTSSRRQLEQEKNSRLGIFYSNNLDSFTAANKVDDIVTTVDTGDKRLDSTVSIIDDVLPSLLTTNGVLQQILINGVLVRQYRYLFYSLNVEYFSDNCIYVVLGHVGLDILIPNPH